MKALLRNIPIILLSITMAGCYFFRKKKASSAEETTTASVLGTPIDDQASGPDELALQELYAITSQHEPAAIRPDPDQFVRRILLQYRSEGATIAREIGRVEQYRILLGGASEDFSTTPQETYDATSLLAIYKVSEEICRGLVAPDDWNHPGWATILPHGVTNVQGNVTWLAQRMIGKPTADIDASIITSLVNIVETGRAGESHTQEHYIPACATLLLDAESLLL